MKQLQHVAVTAKGAPASAPFFAILADDATGFIRPKAPSWRELAAKLAEGVPAHLLLRITVAVDTLVLRFRSLQHKVCCINRFLVQNINYDATPSVIC